MRVNEQIRVLFVRLIDAAGENYPSIAIADALALAKEQELDLVEVSPQAKPPVCRILDYGKFQYQQTKQIQQAKAKQKKVETKGIRIGLHTDTHDLEFKRGQAEKFLTKGNKVKAEILLRGREKALPDKAKTALQNFLKTITIPYTIEEEMKRFPAGFHVIITPQ
jgi:translation initiation factor IF-3